MTSIRPGGGVTTLVLNREAIQRLFLPGGDVWSWGRRLGEETELVAKGLLVPGAGYVTGELERSVGHSIVPVGQGVQVNVRATARHARFYILGTPPHVIESSRIITVASGKFKGQRTTGWMKFFWLKAGKTVYAQHVNHPGFRGRNFLDEAKDIVLARRGIT